MTLSPDQNFNRAACPVVLPALCFIGGIIAADILPHEALPFIAAFFAACALVLWFIKRHSQALALTVVVLGLSDAMINTPAPLPDIFSDSRHSPTLFGTVTDVKSNDNASTLTVRVDSATFARGTVSTGAFHPFLCSVTYTSDGTLPRLTPGDEIAFMPEQLQVVPREEAFFADLTFNSYYKSNGISAACMATPDNLTIVAHHVSFKGLCLSWRDKLVDIIYSSPLSDDTAFFLASVLLGDDTYFPEENAGKFRSIGLAHMLALSGFHLALIIFLLSIALYPLKLLGRRAVWRYPMMMVFIWLYACVTGLMPPVIRAAVVASVFLLGKTLRRDSNPFNSLAVAALVILLPDPQALFSPGFQLSFTAVLAILAFASRLNPFSPRRHPRLHKAAEAFTVPLAAMAGTAVIVAYHFHSLPIWFLLSNLLAIWIFPLLLGGAVVLICLGGTGSVAALLSTLLDSLYSLMEKVCDLIAKLTPSQITSLFPDGLFTWLTILCLVCLAFYLNGGKKIYARLMVLTLCLEGLVLGLSMLTPVARNDMLVVPSGNSTMIVFRSDTDAVVLSDCRERDRASKLRALNRRCEQYFAYHHCTSPDTVHDLSHDFTLPGMAKRGHVVSVEGHWPLILPSPPSDKMGRRASHRPSDRQDRALPAKDSVQACPAKK